MWPILSEQTRANKPDLVHSPAVTEEPPPPEPPEPPEPVATPPGPPESSPAPPEPPEASPAPPPAGFGQYPPAPAPAPPAADRPRAARRGGRGRGPIFALATPRAR